MGKNETGAAPRGSGRDRSRSIIKPQGRSIVPLSSIKKAAAAIRPLMSVDPIPSLFAVVPTDRTGERFRARPTTKPVHLMDLITDPGTSKSRRRLVIVLLLFGIMLLLSRLLFIDLSY